MNEIEAVLSGIETVLSAGGGRKGYAVGWGTLALINAGLAQSKGRSRGIWFVVSLFLGPLATLMIVVTDEPVQHSAPRRGPAAPPQTDRLAPESGTQR